jgi:indolepyruvate decarboxylase
MMKNTRITVAVYLIRRLKEIGVEHLFGVPGDFKIAGENKSPRLDKILD